MLQSDRISTTPHAIGIELARRQALVLRCGFSVRSMRSLTSQVGGAGPAWSIGAHREADRARGAKAFPFRIGAAIAT